MWVSPGKAGSFERAGGQEGEPSEEQQDVSSEQSVGEGLYWAGSVAG